MSRFKATLILIFIAMSTTCTMTATSPSTATSCTWGFECANKRCIHLLLRCDGTDDCGDFSDETNCTCQTGNFACASGKCINKNWVCDGENDCGDNSDEVNCTAKAVDPCANDGGCYHICKVIKSVNGTPTGRKCDCRLGYYLRGDGTTCEDVDECMTPNICAGKCHNTEGSYYCDCKAGFKMGSDMKSCIDVNECDVNNGGCEHLCHNNIGSYTCSCKTGYVRSYRNPKHCEDFDECSLGVPKCHECHNIPGGYACKCDKGFIQNANKTSCMDVDECAKGNAGCEHICKNLPGSYECRCKHGFKAPAKGSKSCEDIDECAANRGRGPCEYGCRNNRGSYRCFCGKGRMLAGDKLSCIDINECQQSKNLCDQKCVNDDPGYHCDCKKGFHLASDGKTCRDTVDYSECGQTSDKFQETGVWKITNRSSWPWIVHFSFHFGGWFAMATQGCLGTILNDRWVITSRHCAEDMDSESSVVEFNNGNQIEVDDVIPYCSWNSKKPCTSNIALIKLRKAISFSANVRPICLPKPSQLSKALRDRSKTLAMILRKQGTTYYKKTVRIRKGKDCTQKWFYSRTMICAGNKKVSCPGDSGTPLMFSLLKNSKKYSVYLGGILGFNSDLADCEQTKSRYLGYVHSQKFLRWIREKTSF